MGDASVGWGTVALTGVLTLIGLLGDLALGYWGARRFGASWKGAVGALLGALIGSFPPLLWLIAGPIIGAVLGALVAGRLARRRQSRLRRPAGCGARLRAEVRPERVRCGTVLRELTLLRSPQS